MPIPPESLQPAHDILRDIWQTSNAEEERLQELIRNTPDPVTGVDPVREDMIRTFEIVRAHRRFTRSCIDLLAWGESVSQLPTRQEKKKAEDIAEAAVEYDKAIDSAHDDLTHRLYGHTHSAGHIRPDDIRSILRNFTYAFHSARADLRKATVGSR
jgi:hypothetical protein